MSVARTTPAARGSEEEQIAKLHARVHEVKINASKKSLTAILKQHPSLWIQLNESARSMGYTVGGDSDAKIKCYVAQIGNITLDVYSYRMKYNRNQ